MNADLRSWLYALCLAFVAIAVSAGSALAQTDSAQTRAAGTHQVFVPVVANESPALCRFGVNGSIRGIDPVPLRIGWYVDYQGTLNAVEPGAVEYFPFIRLVQTGPTSYYFGLKRLDEETIPATPAELKALIAKRPGGHWFIGNEPDRREVQDDIEPAVYAVAYHDLYTLIKAEDPTAIVIVGSIVQATPLRLQYLDIVLETYRNRYGVPLPADAWAIHNFILNEVSCRVYPDLSVCWGADIPPGIDAVEGLRVRVRDNDDFALFVEQIQRFRRWLADHGYRGAPVFLSEYGVLMPDIFAPPDDFPPSRVNAYMNKTFDYLLNTTDQELGDPTDGYRLVQRLSWYSVSDTEFNGNLYAIDPSGSDKLVLTDMGRNYAAYTAALPLTTDFTPVSLGILPAVPLAANGPVTLTLQATIANSGNTAAATTVAVRFYDGNPSTGGQPIGSDQIVAVAGCGEDVNVSVQWPNVAPGEYTVFVQVDPDHRITEADEQNNTRNRDLTFAVEQLFLPAQAREYFGS